MIRIEIDIPRPKTTLAILAAAAGIVAWIGMGGPGKLSASVLPLAGVGGEPVQEEIKRAETEASKARIQQQVLARRAEILRFELQQIQEQRRLMVREMDPALEDEYRRSIAMLTELLKDQAEAEARIAESLREMWEAEDHGNVIAPAKEEKPIRIAWPVEPAYGISAMFLDAEYEEHFGIPHRAIDIPALQESIITAAADGVVEEVTDNGKGYNWITIRHEGYATLYGHILEPLIREGDAVWQGDPIALSGGLPGTEGAGYLTTGPHLHFEVILDDGRVDPLKYLPDIPGLMERKRLE